MSKYQGKYKCGHDGVTEIYGPSKDREWKAKRFFDDLCPKCSFLKTKADNEAAAKLNSEKGLPELVGSVKQVDWANRIRDHVVTELWHNEEQPGDSESVKYWAAIKAFIFSKTSASWWINSDCQTAYIFVSRNRDEIMALAETHAEAHAESTDPAPAAVETYMLKPVGADPSIVADVRVVPASDDGKAPLVEIRSPKDDVLRATVKEAGYSWDADDRCWYRRITAMRGPVNDRVTEICAKLLAAGIGVTVPTKDIYDRIVSGEYECEQVRWIDFRDDTFRIIYPRDEDIYSKARKIPGYRWNSAGRCYVSPSASYAAVRDFAGLLGFSVTAAAAEAFTRQDAIMQNALAVDPKIKKIDTGDGLGLILQSPDDVLPDLMDDTDDDV